MSLRRWSMAGVTALVVAAACGGGDSDPRQVIVDNDGAFDDIKAIVYLLEQPDVEVVAITVSGTGIARCPVAAGNIAAMLDRVGAPEIPVACGRSTPLRGDNEAPPFMRDAADTLGGVDLPEPPDLAGTSATELLAETLAGSGDITLVALGPLTNVAEVFERDPDLVDRVDRIYLMGGAVETGGNVFWANERAEFNIWADSLAAQMVFETDVPITMIPLDATNVVPVTPHLYEAVAAHRTASPTAEFMDDYLTASPLLGGLYHWDELAAVITMDESVATLEERLLVVNAAGGPASGATLQSDSGRPVQVAVDANRAMFEARFYAAILGTADPGVPEWTPDAVLSWNGSDCTYDGPDPLLETMWIRIDNDSDQMIAWLVGRYDAAATADDWEEYVTSGTAEPPDWWTPTGQIAVPAGARDVWPIDAGIDDTAICYVDEANFWEVAGPRLAP